MPDGMEKFEGILMSEFVGAKRAIALAGIAGSLLWGSAASANTVSIGLQEAGVNASAVTTVASSPAGQAAFTGSYGQFLVTSDSGTGLPTLSNGQILDSHSLNVAIPAGLGGVGGTLYVWVAEYGLTGSATYNFTSSFTNQLTGSVTMSTFIDTTNGTGPNGAYANTGVGTTSAALLASHAFTTIGNDTQTVSVTNPGTYSVLELYKIVLPAGGSASATIDLSVACTTCAPPPGVPLPAALPLFASILGGGMLVGAARRRKAAKAAAV
jgi:hypothetical protein